MEENAPRYIAFDGTRRIAAGPLREVARKVKETHDARPECRILVFDATNSELVDLDLRGTAAQVLRRLPAVEREIASPPNIPPTASPAPAGPGRPRLGVVAREVTLLPRHWEWLKTQPGGASVALRKLVEQARRASASADRVRQSQNATYQFMSVMAGNLGGFEEASRALFAADLPRFEALVAAWPVDIRDHIRHLAETAFQAEITQLA